MERAGTVRGIEENRSFEALAPQLHKDNLPQTGSPGVTDPSAAKRYTRLKLLLGLIQTALVFAATLAAVATGLTRSVEEFVRHTSPNDYLVLLGFVLLLGAGETLLTFPLRWYSGYVLEHRFRLSNQTFFAWAWEGLKGTLVGIPIFTPILLALFYCLKNFGPSWWLPVGIVLFIISVVLARLAPIFIFPLFYTFRLLEDGKLRERILQLCERVGMNVSGVFVFNMSKNTKKANAGFTGIGRAKRIILADTLVANFTDEEIETVFAHELGHYKLRHIWIMMAVGTFSTFAGLFCTSEAYRFSLSWFGFASQDTIAALPLLGLWLGVYSLVTTPLSNMLSREHERAADGYAIKLSGNKQAFANALNKLAAVNLADRNPHPLVEFLFFSHPSIEKRIKALGAL